MLSLLRKMLSSRYRLTQDAGLCRCRVGLAHNVLPFSKWQPVTLSWPFLSYLLGKHELIICELESKPRTTTFRKMISFTEVIGIESMLGIRINQCQLVV